MRPAIDLEAGPELDGSSEAVLVREPESLPLPVTDTLRVLKNFLSQAGSNLAAQAFAFFSTAYVARCLRAEGFGWVGFAQGLLAYFTLMTDLGLRTVGMREVAKHREDVSTWVGYILGLRLALAGISMAVFLAVVVLIPNSLAFKLFLVEYGFIIFTSALLLDWAFQGLERMEMAALGEVLRAGSYLALVVVGLHHRSQILRVPIFTVLSQLCPAGLLLGVFWRQVHGVRLGASFAVWKDLLRQSLPISLGGLALQLGGGLGVVLLGLLRRDVEVGYFKAAFQLASMPGAFTVLFGFVMYPVMARYRKQQQEKLSLLTQYTGRFLVLMVLPVVIGGWMFASSLVPLVYGPGFPGSVLLFQILLGYALIAHLYCPFYYLLLACDREKAFMNSFLAGAVVALVANVALIPAYGAVGAAVATVAWHATILLWQYRACRELVSLPVRKELLRISPLALLLLLTMGLTPASWVVRLLLGLSVYAGLLVIWERKMCAQVLRSLRFTSV